MVILSNKSTSLSFALTKFDEFVKLFRFEDESKSKVASSSTAVGASFIPLILITISAVDVCPVSSVTV